MNFVSKNKFIVVLFIAFFTISCSTQKTSPKLELLAEQYEKAGEHEKAKAARFLIANMNDFGHIDGEVMQKYEPFFSYLDSLNKAGIQKKIKGSLQLKPEIDSVWNNVKSTLSNEDFSNLKFIFDTTLSNEFFKTHIDQSFNSWKTNKWAKHVSFNDFCEYILPHRVYNESPENWREYFIHKYSALTDTIKTHSPTEIANAVNKDIEKWFSFSPLCYEYPFDMGLERLLKGSIGNCNHMVTITTYANRALGIPCAVDFAPQYGNRSSGHSWIVVFDSLMNAIPYNAASTEWLEMGYVFHNQTLNIRIPKVYRKYYSIQENKFSTIPKNDEYYPKFFENRHIKDITSEYMPVTDVLIKIDNSDRSNDLAYLCIFNNKDWVPVEWAEIQNSSAMFENMGRDIVYLPVCYINKEMIPLAEPFILNELGQTVPIQIYKGKAQSAKLFYKYPPELTANNDSTNAILLNDRYELFYWDNEWVSLGEKTTMDRERDIDSLGFDFKKQYFFDENETREYLFYENVPVGALFLLRNHTQGKEERIFTIDGTEQVWW